MLTPLVCKSRRSMPRASRAAKIFFTRAAFFTQASLAVAASLETPACTFARSGRYVTLPVPVVVIEAEALPTASSRHEAVRILFMLHLPFQEPLLSGRRGSPLRGPPAGQQVSTVRGKVVAAKGRNGCRSIL